MISARFAAIRNIRRETGSPPALSFRALRWLAIGIPTIIIVGFDYLRHFVFPFSLFHDSLGFVAIWGSTLVGSFLFSRIVFGIIERMQREILDQNRDLSLLNDAASRQAEQLKALHDASMALSAELSLEAVLQKVVDLSRELVGAQYAALAVSDQSGVERLITSGLDQHKRDQITAVRRVPGLMAAVPDRDKPLRLQDIHTHPLFRGFPPNHPDMQSFLGVPIMSKGQVIGNLRLTNKLRGEPFMQEDEDIVVMLAAQAAIAIENARLYEQEQVLAILQERERIAQDLHDGIIQDIYAIGLGLEQCIEQAGLPAHMPERLTRAVDNLNDIIKEIRNYIFALEPTDLQGSDLAAGLGNMTQEFRINSLIDAELNIHGNVSGALSRDQVGQLLHIVHEALTNVLKHARATAVTIDVKRFDGRLEFCIADNGIGFDTAKKSRTGLGLRNIIERSRALGGSVNITSAPSTGSRLTIGIPIPAKESDDEY